ncbi:MAG: hypothetical protein WC933_02990 [Candidatus Paceibacterota bacterium]|jgi:hypothetical protein
MDDIEKLDGEKGPEPVFSLPPIEEGVVPEVSDQVFSLPSLESEEKVETLAPKVENDNPSLKINFSEISFEKEASISTPVTETKTEEKDISVAVPTSENSSHREEEREKFKVIKKVEFFKLKSKKILSWILWLIRCQISDPAKEIYDTPSFVLGDKKKILELVFIKPEYLGLVSDSLSGGFTHKKVSEAAISAGLMLCPQDTVFNLVLRGKKPKKGIEWITGMEPIPDAKGKVFSVVHYYDGSVQIQTVDSGGLSSKDSIWIFQK